MHCLLDSLLSPGFRTLTLKLLTKLLQPDHDGVYIPGETMDNERTRVEALQCGILPVLFSLAEKDEMVRQHICVCYCPMEVEASLTRLARLIHRGETPAVLSPGKDTAKGSVSWPGVEHMPKPRVQVSSYVALWQDRELELSE